MIRVSGLKEEEELGLATLSADGLAPKQQLEKLRERILPLVDQQSNCLNNDVLPKLAQAGLELVSFESLTRFERQSLQEYFVERVFPILTPLGVDPSHPFPYISPLSVNLCLIVEAPDQPVGLGSKHVRFRSRITRSGRARQGER